MFVAVAVPTPTTLLSIFKKVAKQRNKQINQSREFCLWGGKTLSESNLLPVGGMLVGMCEKWGCRAGVFVGREGWGR